MITLRYAARIATIELRYAWRVARIELGFVGRVYQAMLLEAFTRGGEDW